MALETGATKQQKIILGILAVAGLYMFYSKVYAPIGDKIKETRETLKKKSSQLADMRVKAQQLEVLEQELKLLEEHLKKTEKRLPKSEEIPKFIRTITDTAAKYGMEVKSLSIGGAQGSQYYTTHSYGLQLISDYHTFGKFFAEIGQMDRIFNIHNLTLNPAGGMAEEEGQLSARFSIIAYTAKQ